MTFKLYECISKHTLSHSLTARIHADKLQYFVRTTTQLSLNSTTWLDFKFFFF